MLTNEIIGDLFLRTPSYKFPGYFLREGLIGVKKDADSNLRNPNNYFLTEKGYNVLELEIPEDMNVKDSLLSDIEAKFSHTELGVFGKKGPRANLKKNIKLLKERRKFTDKELLEAIDLYISEVNDKKYCRQSDYAIYKDGTFHIEDFLERVQNGERLNDVIFL